MSTLFQAEAVNELNERLERLQPNSPRQWGKMTPAQAVAHLARSMEMATGDWKPSRMFAGYLFGPIVKNIALKDDQPLGKNAPTMSELKVHDDRDLNRERQRLATLVQQFANGGAARCTSHPHSFFGKLTPDQWAKLMYKHIDHHLRQFGV